MDIKYIDVNFKYLQSTNIRATQWDFGQVLRIHGINTNAKISTYFSIDGHNTAKLQPHENQSGIITVKIPQSILEQDKKAFLFIRANEDKSEKTIGTIILTIRSQTKPSNYYKMEG